MCKVDGCERESVCRGYCNPHYQRWYNYGDPEGGQFYKRIINITGRCSVEGCVRKPRSNIAQHCEMHYYRLRRTGSLGDLPLEIDYSTIPDLEITQDLAWCLGIIWSDGNLQGNSISVCSMDREIVDQVEQILGYYDKIIERHDPRLHYVFRVCDPVLAFQMRKLGLIESKSLVIEWPSIPKECYWAFLRGVLDGDGTVNVIKSRKGQTIADASIRWYSGSEKFAKRIRDRLIELEMPATFFADTKKRHNPFYSVTIQKRQAVKKAIDFLYPANFVPALSRKRNKLLEWNILPLPKIGRPKKLQELKQSQDK